MVRAVVNVAAGDSVAGLILRQKRDIEALEEALAWWLARDKDAFGRGDEFRELLSEQVTA